MDLQNKMHTPKLTICVPTHNRGEFLEAWFEENFEAINDKRIKILIHDNGSSDTTPEVVKKYKNVLHNIHHIRTDVATNFDNSVLRCVDEVETDYFWPIGDTYLISKELVSRLLLILSEHCSHNAIIFNINKRYKGIGRVFENYDELLSNVAGVNACLATTVYRTNKKPLNLKRFIGYGYIHSAILFEESFGREVSVLMISDLSIEVIRRKGLKKRSWAYSRKSLEIVTNDWNSHLKSLSGYDPHVHRGVSSAVGEITRLFSMRGVMLMRSTNAVRPSSLKLITSNVPFKFAKMFYVYVLISLIFPKIILYLMLNLKERIS
ncbi:MAG: glycosyltransferase family 2 protein [Rhodothermales bacterium]